MAIPKNRTEIENLIVYGIDPKNRTIHFGAPLSSGTEEPGSVSQLSIGTAVRAICSMVQDAPKKPITIYMNSGGGSPVDAAHLIDLILSSTTQFIFYGGGAIQSAATLIMAVCDERHLYENTEVMIHEVSAERDELPERLSELKIFLNALQDTQNKMCKTYEENSFMNAQFWQDISRSDLYLTAHETVKLGLAEFVVPQKKRGNLRKRRVRHLGNPPHEKTMNALVKRIYDRTNINPSTNEIKIHMPAKDQVDDDLVVDNTPMEIISNDNENQNDSE